MSYRDLSLADYVGKIDILYDKLVSKVLADETLHRDKRSALVGYMDKQRTNLRQVLVHNYGDTFYKASLKVMKAKERKARPGCELGMYERDGAPVGSRYWAVRNTNPPQMDGSWWPDSHFADWVQPDADHPRDVGWTPELMQPEFRARYKTL